MRFVAAAIGLPAMLGARLSSGGGVEPVRLPDGSALPALEFDRHIPRPGLGRRRRGRRQVGLPVVTGQKPTLRAAHPGTRWRDDEEGR